MKIKFGFLLCLGILSFFSSSCTTSIPKREPIIIGSLLIGKNFPISSSKAEAGLNFAFAGTDKYSLITSSVNDSLSKVLHPDNPAQTTIQEIAQEADAQKAAFVRLDKLHTIVRAEITMASARGKLSPKRGVGFALATHRTEKSGEIIYDPAILTAFQRALCSALGDSSLYAENKGVYNVIPADPIVAGSIEFIDNPSILPKWNIFQGRAVTDVNAYDLANTITLAGYQHRHFVFYDMDARDTLFALFKLHRIENDKPVSVEELSALHKLDVVYYINGSVTRTSNGVRCLLRLSTIEDDITLRVLYTEEADGINDDIEDIKKIFRGITLKLLDKQAADLEKTKTKASTIEQVE